jgi:hypothetical protein
VSKQGKQPSERFDAVEDQHGKFEGIGLDDRLGPYPLACAMAYLHQRFGAEVGDICSAEHDEVYLNSPDADALTDADVLYLARCGVFWSDSNCGLMAFV